ncbi:hypothetical protein PAXINDRAFT_157787 [Paxillus involutus ATCC 200175]|uniref:Uncharacterized protein n=1 Tax=Paxillus involutus ATCC 200175 TaxID=664439 RepID=A0A0C9TQ59_PAXIN|nr:hypothetical protein PAXINDRAFT_157787 [Paxillus involutus ATCC 200175]
MSKSFYGMLQVEPKKLKRHKVDLLSGTSTSGSSEYSKKPIENLVEQEASNTTIRGTMGQESGLMTIKSCEVSSLHAAGPRKSTTFLPTCCQRKRFKTRHAPTLPSPAPKVDYQSAKANYQSTKASRGCTF